MSNNTPSLNDKLLICWVNAITGATKSELIAIRKICRERENDPALHWSDNGVYRDVAKLVTAQINRF